MAYFSNGTEATDYQFTFCANCHHDRNGDCPILMLHFRFANEADEDDCFLHELIPQAEDGLGNEQCRMFLSVDLVKGA